MTTFAVVVETSPHDMAVALDTAIETEQPTEESGYLPKVEALVSLGRANMELALMLRHPVFTLGEILILGDDGREVSGVGRKPSKWFVVIEEFDTIDLAIQRAIQINASEENS